MNEWQKFWKRVKGEEPEREFLGRGLSPETRERLAKMPISRGPQGPTFCKDYLEGGTQ